MCGCFGNMHTVLWLILYSDLYCTLTEVFLILTEGFPCFFLSCKANARVKPAKTGHGPHTSKLIVIYFVSSLFVLFYVLFVSKFVLYYCHRVSTQLQLNIYRIISYHISYIISYIISYVISHHISYHIISYILYHIISYIISYYIIYHIISYHVFW
jgi:uncharacterized protein YacL